jgi:hypothetical protein
MKQPAAPSVLALLFAKAVTAAAVTPPPGYTKQEDVNSDFIK